jgi:hypothetical protein
MSCFRKLSVLLLTVFAALAQAYNAYAEPLQLFERVPAADLTPTQQDELSKLQKGPTTISAEAIRVDPNVLKADNQFNLNLTRDTSLTIKKFQSGNELSYIAESPNITVDWFIVHGDSVDFRIRSTDGTFIITPLGHGFQALVKLEKDTVVQVPSVTKVDAGCPGGVC